MPPTSCITLDLSRLDPASLGGGAHTAASIDGIAFQAMCEAVKRDVSNSLKASAHNYKALYDNLLEATAAKDRANQTNRKNVQDAIDRLTSERDDLRQKLATFYETALTLAQTAQLNPRHPIHAIDKPVEYEEHDD